MINQKIEELAKIYGIEINDVETGNGGLYYIDSYGTKIILNDIFDLDDYATPKHESVSFEECSAYSTYSEIVALMLNAA